MNHVKNLFNAEASNLGGMMIETHGGTAGFKVPEYQRIYDWSEENLDRLMTDCLSGFYQFSKSKGSRYPHTFLGTIILVKEKDSDFSGSSLALVDGQQRITSLVLLCCTLFERINRLMQSITSERLPNTPPNFIEWLEAESEHTKTTLHSCAIGRLPKLGKSIYFPRIVRAGDGRGEKQYSEYRSGIGQLLINFHHYCFDSSMPSFNLASSGNKKTDSSDREFERLSNSYKLLRKHVENLYIDDIVGRVKREKFEQIPLKDLFEKSSNYNQSQWNKIKTYIKSSDDDLEKIVRTILFSYYMLNYVVLTRVETEEEGSAFDIFDALNTTGIPLTAIETLKPLVVSFENNYSESESRDSFSRLEENLDEIIKDNNDKRQIATKELVTSFALYFNGVKLLNDLRGQRKYLRSSYESLTEANHKQQFVKSIADLAQFRKECWMPEGDLGARIKFTIPQNRDTLQLCLALLRGMRHQLIVPIAARYWDSFKNERAKEDQFVVAIQALTAFVALRRGFTGGTSQIDNDFRSIMRSTPQTLDRKSLCLGLDFSNSLWEVEELKMELRNYLSKLLGDEDLNRDTWVNTAKEIPLYRNAQVLCRFLLLAAAHNSSPDKDKPGLMTREDLITSKEWDFLNYRTWENYRYATVEHIVPRESGRGSGWGKEFYEPTTRPDTIGNLTLLPLQENSVVGNNEWGRKKLYYKIFNSKRDEERQEYVSAAAAAGMPVKPTTLNFLKEKNERLEILDSITNVPNWTVELIENRSKNILELAWGTIAPWLDLVD